MTAFSGGEEEPDSHVFGYRTPRLPNVGSTPIEIAESNGFLPVVELLKRHADPKAER